MILADHVRARRPGARRTRGNVRAVPASPLLHATTPEAGGASSSTPPACSGPPSAHRVGVHCGRRPRCGGHPQHPAPEATASAFADAPQQPPDSWASATCRNRCSPSRGQLTWLWPPGCRNIRQPHTPPCTPDHSRRRTRFRAADWPGVGQQIRVQWPRAGFSVSLATMPKCSAKVQRLSAASRDRVCRRSAQRVVAEGPRVVAGRRTDTMPPRTTEPSTSQHSTTTPTPVDVRAGSERPRDRYPIRGRCGRGDVWDP
jgi:hypothetical protein